MRRGCQRFLVLRAMMPNLVTQELSTLALQLTAKRVLAVHDKICRSRPPCAILVTVHLIRSCRPALISPSSSTWAAEVEDDGLPDVGWNSYTRTKRINL